MPPKGGRHPALKWFTAVTTDDGDFTQCLRCKTLLSSKVMSATDRTRQMQQHLETLKCRSAAAQASVTAAPLDGSAATAVVTTSSGLNVSAGGGSSLASAPLVVNVGDVAGAAETVRRPLAGGSVSGAGGPTMDSFCIRWTAEQDAVFQERQAQWMCATGLSFRVFDHPLFSLMMGAANPALTPASGFVLRSRLLPALYQTERNKLSDLVRGRMVHLQADGVTDNVHESSFCVTAIVDGSAYFYGQFPNDGESQDAKYYASKLQTVFDDIRKQGGCIASLTMDNTGKADNCCVFTCLCGVSFVVFFAQL
jgi:hypothetical protein